jgi:purine-binding chemotaxis protein CheW
MKRLATFTIGDSWFGVDVLRVREVVRSQDVTPIPLAPPDIAGLINLRGEIVTALDLRVRLGEAVRRDPMNMIMTGAHGPVSLLVDDAGDVLEVDDAAFERRPSTLREPARDLILGSYPIDGRLLLELDVTRAIDETTPGGADVEMEDR